MNFRFFFLILFVYVFMSAQQREFSFVKHVNGLKKENNIAEYIYVHLDEYAKKPTVENLVLFQNLEKSIWRRAENKKEALSFIYFYINYGYYLKEFGQLNNAIVKYEKGYSVYQKFNVQQYDIIEYCLKPLANCYTRIGEMTRAEDVLKVTIENAQQQKNTEQVVAAYINLAAVKRTKGEFVDGISLLNLALKLNKDQQVKATLFSELAINYFEISSYEKSGSYLALSNGLNTAVDSTLTLRNYVTLGVLQFKQNKVLQAEAHFTDALKIAEKIYSKNHREVCKIYVHLAMLQAHKKDYVQAQKTYQKVLTLLIPSFKPTKLTDNPETSFLYPENTLTDIFDGRAAVFVEMGDPENALKNFDLAFKIEDELRFTYVDQNAKIIHQQENRRRSEKCIEICYQLFVEHKNEKWAEKAFLYTERTKNSVVAEAKEKLQKQTTLGSHNLFVLEKELLFKKAQYTKNIALEQLKGEGASINILAELTKNRNAISTELKLVTDKMYLQFPQLKSEIDSGISKTIIQQKVLNNANCFIEFFDGSTYLYRFSIEKNKSIAIKRIEKSAGFMRDMETFIGFFSDERGTEIQNNIHKYTTVGFKLYSVLFGNIPKGNIIIVPDGLLNFIPLDALITEKTSSTNFSNLPYLIYKNPTVLAYSAAILLQNTNNKKNKNTVLGFFPVFEKNYRGLSELRYTAMEAVNIQQHFKGKFLLKHEATKKMFESEVNKYEIIHLSTHATAGSFYEPPAIEFYDETLYLPEIYGYNLQTDLLVLSACETGVGAISKGEGAMSLAYGFAYAGVQNLVVSLWKVNDKATEKLMDGFYTNLDKTGNKANSLTQSKLNYLASEEITVAKKSPYYWASFVYIGAVDSNKETLFSIWWLLVVGIIIGITYFLSKKS